MDPRYMDMARNPIHSGIKQMQNIGTNDAYQTRGLYEIIQLLHLANPKLNKKDLLLQMLQRDLDQGNNESEFSKAYQQNQQQMQQRHDLNIPTNMPFSPGSIWM